MADNGFNPPAGDPRMRGGADAGRRRTGDPRMMGGPVPPRPVNGGVPNAGRRVVAGNGMPADGRMPVNNGGAPRGNASSLPHRTGDGGRNGVRLPADGLSRGDRVVGGGGDAGRGGVPVRPYGSPVTRPSDAGSRPADSVRGDVSVRPVLRPYGGDGSSSLSSNDGARSSDGVRDAGIVGSGSHGVLQPAGEGGGDRLPGRAAKPVRTGLLKPVKLPADADGVDSDDARRLKRMMDDEAAGGQAARKDYSDSGKHGKGTGRRGRDLFKRNRRAGQGVILNEQQIRKLDEVNRLAMQEDDALEPFVMNARDRRVLDYLVKWRFSTIRDIGRVAGWSESYMKTNRRFNTYIDLGFVTADRVPMENFRYVQPTPTGVLLSDYAYLGSESVIDFLRAYRGHSFGLCSLASHLMNRQRDADETERDLLGVGEDEYYAIRHEILDGKSKVIAEREYRSSWQSIRSGAGRSPAALTDARFRHAMEKEYMEAHADRHDVGSPLTRQTFEMYCTNPEYKGDMAWLWIAYGNDIIQSDGNGGIRRMSVDNAAVDSAGRPVIVSERGDLFSTRDHCPDMIIARPRDRSTGRPNSIAVELEITAKSEEDYMRTMCSYTGACGRLLYKTVVWQVVNAALGNLIRRGCIKAGAVEGRDFVIAPVYSEDTRSSFNRGADMLPGAWMNGDEPRGYTVLKTLMEDGIDADLG